MMIPAFFMMFFVGRVLMFAMSKRFQHLLFAVVAALGLSIWMDRAVIFSVLTGESAPEASPPSVFLPALAASLPSPWWLLVLPIGMCVFFLIDHLDRLAQRHVPTVSLQPGADGLEPLIHWLRDVRGQVPSNISAAVQRIADHVTVLEALRIEMPDASLPLTEVRALIGQDMRDHLVRWKRVETATRMLPGKQSAGVGELAGGCGRIEAALVGIREQVASAALNDLKVSDRYLELKHGEPNA